MLKIQVLQKNQYLRSKSRHNESFNLKSTHGIQLATILISPVEVDEKEERRGREKDGKKIFSSQLIYPV